MSGAPCGARLRRLLAADGRCFDVAIDHGLFNTPGFLAGIENMEAAVRTVVTAAPDAVQLTPGQAPLLDAAARAALASSSAPARIPALVLRVDVANVYGPHPPPELFCTLMEEPVEQALRLDAACVVAFLLLVPGRTDLHRQCVANLCRLKPACERYGVPLMVEPIAMRDDGRGGYGVDGDAATIATLVRQAVELGADVIKADPTDDLAEMPRVLEVAGRRPLLVRGGSKASEEEILRRTQRLIAQGAAGIVYGRNVIQHPDPAAITRALMAVVHDGASAEDAQRLLRAA